MTMLNKIKDNPTHTALILVKVLGTLVTAAEQVGNLNDKKLKK